MLQEKNREVEWLRAQKAVDDVSQSADSTSILDSDIAISSVSVKPRSDSLPARSEATSVGSDLDLCEIPVCDHILCFFSV